MTPFFFVLGSLIPARAASAKVGFYLMSLTSSRVLFRPINDIHMARVYMQIFIKANVDLSW